jgi:hypothetical protein
VQHRNREFQIEYRSTRWFLEAAAFASGSLFAMALLYEISLMISRMPLLDEMPRLETVGTTIGAFFKSRVGTWPIRRTLLSMELHIIGSVTCLSGLIPTIGRRYK